MAYIDRDMAISRINSIRPVNPNKSDYTHGIDVGIAMAKVAINEQPTADVVDKERYDRLLENATIISKALKKYQTADMKEVVRCKDCVHRPKGTGANHDLEFPDYVCPCQCDVFWRRRMPKDDEFCADGESREE